jgi:hypothetical protein
VCDVVTDVEVYHLEGMVFKEEGKRERGKEEWQGN